MALTKNMADTIASFDSIDYYINHFLIPKYILQIKTTIRDICIKIPNSNIDKYIRGFSYKNIDYSWFDIAPGIPYDYVALPSEFFEYFDPIHQRDVEIQKHITKVKQYLNIKYALYGESGFNAKQFMPKCYGGWNDELASDIHYQRIEKSLHYLYALELIV